MKNKKVLILFLVLNLFLSNLTGIYAYAKAPKQLKGSVEDYRIQYTNIDWWNNYNDPILSGYIQKAVQNNHDIKIASLRVKEGQEMVKTVFAKQLPMIGIEPEAYVQKASDTLKFGSFRLSEYTQGSYVLPLNVSYELDLWGKNRDKTSSAKKEFEAMKYDEKAAYISLTTAVAATYFNVIKSDKLIEIQKNILSLRKQQYNLTKVKSEYGLCARAEVLSAERLLNEEQIKYSDLQKQQALFLNQLAVLTGESSDDSVKLKRSSLDSYVLLENLPADLPSSIVLKRPDILKAEAQLQKAKIDVRIARKNFLPTIDLFGQIGFNSNIFKKAVGSESYAAAAGGSLAENIFTGGFRRAVLKSQKYEYEAMFENYQKVILESFQEVNDSLMVLKLDSKKYKDNYKKEKIDAENASLISYKLDDGTISQLDSLESKVKLLQTQKDKYQSKTDYFIDTLSLYKASGGNNLLNKDIFIDVKK